VEARAVGLGTSKARAWDGGRSIRLNCADRFVFGWYYLIFFSARESIN
jgi:hypothetical protein